MPLNILRQIIKWCAYLSVFTPLIIIKSSLFPFVVPKTIIFFLLVELAFFCWLLLLWSDKEIQRKLKAVIIPFRHSAQPHPEQTCHPELVSGSQKHSFSILFWGVTAFVGAILITSYFGVDFHKSFWGNYERMFGWFSIVHFYAFFIILFSVFNKEDFKRLFSLSVVAACFVALYGFIQIIFGVSFTGAVRGWRIESTLGNSAILATYLLFNLFFAVYLLIITSLRARQQASEAIPLENRHCEDPVLREGRGTKQSRGEVTRLLYPGTSARFAMTSWLYSAAVLLLLLAIIFTGTRGAWLGLGIGFLVLAAFILLAKKENLQPLGEKAVRILRIGFASILIVGALTWAFLFVNKDKIFVADNPLLSRVTAVSLQDVTTQTRLVAWQMSLDAIMEKPITGWGWENYNVAFNEHYDVRLYPTENWFDRAHNFYLDILSTIGVIGFAAYLVFILSIFAAAWKAFRSRKIHYLGFALLISFLFVYLAQNAFLFDTPVSFLPLFILLGYLLFLEVQFPKEVVLPNIKIAAEIPVSAIVVTFTLFLLIAYLGLFKPYLAGAYAVAGGRETIINVESVREKFDKALETSSFSQREVIEQLVNKTEDMEILEYDENKIDEYREFLRGFALPKTEEFLSSRQVDLRDQYNLLRMYWFIGFFDRDYYRKGEELGEKLIEEFPTKIPIYAFVGKFKFKNHKPEEALALYDKLMVLKPDSSETHWSLGIVYLENDVYSEGDRFIRKAMALGYEPSEGDIAFVAQKFAVKEQYLWALPYYEKLVKMNPDNPQYWLGLAILYKEANLIPEARDAINKFSDLDPSRQPLANQFLEELK